MKKAVKKKANLKYFIASLILAFILTSLILTIKLPRFQLPRLQLPHYNLSKNQLNFLTGENEAYFDPLELKALIDQKDSSLLIVDLRSKKEYQQAHIKGAISIPSYKDAKNVYQSQTEKNKIFNQIKKIAKNKKLIVVYSYSSSNLLAKKTAAFLINKGLPVKLLNIGFKDWQMDFFRWMPEAALEKYNPDKYLEK